MLAALVLPLAVIKVTSPTPANATGGWPQTLNDVIAIDVATHPDGSASVFACGNGSNGALVVRDQSMLPGSWFKLPGRRW